MISKIDKTDYSEKKVTLSELAKKYNCSKNWMYVRLKNNFSSNKGMIVEAILTPEKVKRFKRRNQNRVYFDCEQIACEILNSEKMKTKWKRDFELETREGFLDWDVLNSDGVKVEVKETCTPYRFFRNHFQFHWPNQHKQIIMSFLKDKKTKKPIRFDLVKNTTNKAKSGTCWESLLDNQNIKLK